MRTHATASGVSILSPVNTNDMGNKKGFTIVELLIVIILIGMVLSVGLPVSYGMYANYRASLSAQEVMACVSELRRDAFLFSDRKVLTSQEGSLMVNGERKTFKGIRIQLAEPIVFFRNGSSSGGTVVLTYGDAVRRLVVKAPLGDLVLESERP